MAGRTGLDSREGKKRFNILHKFEERESLMRENFVNIGVSQEANSRFEE